MFKKLITAVALFFSVSMSHAVIVTLDFEGIAAGQSPGNYYADYGVTFTGGEVRYNHLGAYVASPVTVNFNQPVNNLSFSADGLTIDTHSTVCFSYNGNSVCEPQYLGSVSWMPSYLSPTGKREDWYPGQTWLTEWRYPNIISVHFVTEALTDLTFTMDDVAFPAGEVVTGEVPEPSTILILCLGLIFLYGRHRQDHYKVVEQRA